MPKLKYFPLGKWVNWLLPDSSQQAISTEMNRPNSLLEIIRLMDASTAQEIAHDFYQMGKSSVLVEYLLARSRSEGSALSWARSSRSFAKPKGFNWQRLASSTAFLLCFALHPLSTLHVNRSCPSVNHGFLALCDLATLSCFSTMFLGLPRARLIRCSWRPTIGGGRKTTRIQ